MRAMRTFVTIALGRTILGSLARAAELMEPDHRALAARYRAEANVMRARADEHDAMAKQYSAIGAKGDWATHCRNIAGYYRKLAEENDAMAARARGGRERGPQVVALSGPPPRPARDRWSR